MYACPVEAAFRKYEEACQKNESHRVRTALWREYEILRDSKTHVCDRCR